MIIAQLSDPHIAVDPTTGIPAGEPIAHLQRAIAHLMSLPTLPDGVIVTGDCVNQGLPAEYDLFQDLLQSLSMPVYVIPGNHDHRTEMLKRFGVQGISPLDGYVQYTIEDFPVRLIALDTHIPGSDEGYLCAQRLEWLEARLAEAPTHPTLLFMHHPPLHTGLAVIDTIGLKGINELEALIARHSQVERIVTGHFHMAMMGGFANTVVMVCPATG
jgi:Icc protein